MQATVVVGDPLLPQDLFQQLIQFLPIPSLGSLAATCRSLGGPFVWARIKRANIGYRSNVAQLLSALVESKARLEQFDQAAFSRAPPSDLEAAALVRALFLQSAPTLRRVSVKNSTDLDHLNTVILESLDVAIGDGVLPLLRSECPKLRSLSIATWGDKESLPEVAAAIKALPSIECLTFGRWPIEVVAEISRAHSGRLKSLSVSRSNFGKMFQKRGMDVLTLDVSEAEAFVQTKFGLSLSALTLGDQSIIEYLITNIRWYSFSENNPALRFLLDENLSRLTKYVDFLVPNDANRVMTALSKFANKNMTPRIVQWLGETLSRLLAAMQDNPYADLRTLASLIVLFFNEQEKQSSGSPIISDDFVKDLAQRVKTFIEYDERMLEFLFRAGSKVPASLMGAFFQDKLWLQRVKFDINAKVMGVPIVLQCRLTAALLFFDFEEFDASVESYWSPFFATWLLQNFEDDPAERRSVPAAVGKLAEWYLKHREHIPRLFESFSRVRDSSTLWYLPNLVDYAPLLRLLPREQVLQLVPEHPSGESPGHLIKFITFLYETILGDASALQEALLKMSIALWEETLQSRELQGVELHDEIATLLDWWPLPDQILQLATQRRRASNPSNQSNSSSLSSMSPRIKSEVRRALRKELRARKMLPSSSRRRSTEPEPEPEEEAEAEEEQAPDH